MSKLATFAGGCFWCMQGPFETLAGVSEVVCGYTGGEKAKPTYEEVCTGKTGHVEAVQVRYDPAVVSYAELLEVYWRQIDPTDGGGQFVDRGSQYRTAIFYHDDDQRRAAEEARAALERSGRFADPIAVALLPAGPFYPAEEHHQGYAKKNPGPYARYRLGSGRDGYIDRVWGQGGHRLAATPDDAWRKPADADLRRSLAPLQYEVTQHGATEPPCSNPYWDSKEEGIYVDVVSGEPLFSSLDKFDSGTGWPSFTRPLEAESLVTLEDRGHGMVRTEVRSHAGDSHLGHLFDDGPPPTGQRYCINGAALRFIRVEDLEREGYGRYRALFDKKT